MTLSLCMIVRDEEEVLARCLASVASVVDEIVIVDTGSTDQTKAIARSFGARLFDFTWCQDFAAARNFSFSQAQSDYILWLDADDVLLPDALDKLRALKRTLSHDAYYFRYDYAQDAQGRSNCSFYRERIVRNRPDIVWKYPIHEVLILPVGCSVETRDITVTHRRTPTGSEKDRNRNLSILRHAVGQAQWQDDPRIWYYLGREYADAGEFRQAIASYERFLAFGVTAWIEDRVGAHFRLARCHARLALENDDQTDHVQLARTHCRGAMQLDERWAEPRYVMGELAFREGRYDEAVFWFGSCLRPLPDVLSPVEENYYGFYPHLQLMFCHDKLGEYRQANEHNEMALALAPGDGGLLRNRAYFAARMAESELHQGTPQSLPPDAGPENG